MYFSMYLNDPRSHVSRRVAALERCLTHPAYNMHLSSTQECPSRERRLSWPRLAERVSNGSGADDSVAHHLADADECA